MKKFWDKYYYSLDFWYCIFFFIIILLAFTAFKYRLNPVTNCKNTPTINKNAQFQDANKANDTNNATIIIGILLKLAKTITILFENENETSDLYTKIPNNISPYERLNLEQKIEIFRISQMCNLELEFVEIEKTLKEIKYDKFKNSLELFVNLTTLFSKYCSDRAEISNILLKNNNSYHASSLDNLAMARIIARIKKELNSFNIEIQNIFPKLQQTLNQNGKENLKYYIQLMFSKEINKYTEAYAKTNDITNIYMYSYEWPIINMYLYANRL